MGYDDKNQLKDALKRSITAEQLAYYISKMEGKPMKKTGKGFHVGDGTNIDQKPDCALVFGFSGHVQTKNGGGDVFDIVAAYHNLNTESDFERVIQIVCDEFGFNGAIPQQIQQQTQREPELNTKAIYDAFIAKHWERLRDNLKTPGCMALFKARGLDQYKIQDCQDVGYTTEWIDFYETKDKDGKDYMVKIPCNSLVFRDGKQIKSISFNQNGRRDDKNPKQITGAKQCHWMPLELNDGCDVYLTEGETSAMALIFHGVVYARPLKLQNEGIDIARELARDGHRIILAYDNDPEGIRLTETALQIIPDAIDISGLWRGEGWPKGADPNDFTNKHRGESVKLLLQAEIERQLADKETAKTADIERAKLLESLKTVDDVLDYLKDKNNTRSHSECSTRFYQDPLFGTFCYSLDPYGIRRFAPVACLTAYAVIRLAKYKKRAGGRVLTEQRIVNLCGALKAGKDFVLGTTLGSHSLAYQLQKEKDCYSVSVDNAPPTGNGLSRYALEFAANEQNKGLVKVIIHPESGNALTQGYDATKRAGSLSSFDIGLSNRRVDVPKTGTALKDFKGYNESYEFEGVCVRAFQNVNAQRVIIPRFAGGGESRREMWFAITHPVNDDMCNNKNAQLFEDVLSYSFDPGKCDEVFKSLKEHALPFNPDQGDYYEEQQKDTINIDTGCESYKIVYESLLETVQNPYFRQDKCALIRSQLQFMSALCAGLHGHYIADENDYWCAGYIVEVLSRSLDMIAEWDNRPENTETLHAQILEFVERAGVSGVRADSVFRKFPDGKRAISELLAGDDGEGAPIFRMIDANSKKGNAYYFGSSFRDEVEKDNRFRLPIK